MTAYTSSPAFRDHPRACGEKDWGISVMDYRAGSPPRMRGKERAFACYAENLGITPAHAGKRQAFLPLKPL